MKINIFCEDTIREIHKKNNNINIVIIADFRNIDYTDEAKTIQYIFADELCIDLYPVCIDINSHVEKVLFKYYGNFDYWFVDKTLFEYFS